MLDLFTPAITSDEAGERRDVAAFFRGRPGVFVEVGANEPVRYSQTWHLEQDGWRGVLIEPLKELADKSRSRRKARVFNVACGSYEQHGKFLPLKIFGSLSTFKEDFRNPGIRSKKVRLVKLVTLDSILKQAKIKRIDFLSIDVEGFEVDVLQGFSIARFRPRLLLIEDHGRDWKLHRYLTKRGYKRVRRTNLNSWYVPRATEFPISLFGRWQLIRKYFLGVPLRVIKVRWREWRGPR